MALSYATPEEPALSWLFSFFLQKIWYNFIGECKTKRAKEVNPQFKGLLSNT